MSRTDKDQTAITCATTVPDNAHLVEARILELIPHRQPMLLLNRIVSVTHNSAQAEIGITPHASFFTHNKGVPSWIGIEYMGQTAALIAGVLLEEGAVEPHIGLLLGTRKYSTNTAYFPPSSTLIVHCEEAASVGGNLASFKCTIFNQATNTEYASANLSVFRKPLDKGTHFE